MAVWGKTENGKKNRKMEILLKSLKKIKNIILEPNPNTKSPIPNPQIPNP